jgi:sugar-specific transcriptional regulator TrmB
MTSGESAIQAYLSKLGLSPELTSLYLALYTHGPQNVSQLARSARVERTRIYRLIDKLAEYNLLEVERHNSRNLIKAAPISNVHIVIARREEELKSLEDELNVVEQVLSKDALGLASTYIQSYEGIEGLKQMFWNETASKSENLAILRHNMQSKTNSKFFERWVRRCNERSIKFRGLVSDQFLADQQKWYLTHSNEKIENWQARYLSPEFFPVLNSIIVYDDVVAHYVWQEDRVFGYEVYNQSIADTQRHVFEMLWRNATAVAGHTGKAV